MSTCISNQPFQTNKLPTLLVAYVGIEAVSPLVQQSHLKGRTTTEKITIEFCSNGIRDESSRESEF